MGRRGPKPSNIGELIFWEGMWYREVFKPLRDGIPIVPIEDFVFPRLLPPPKKSGIPELDAERLKLWRKKDQEHWASLHGKDLPTRIRLRGGEPAEKQLWERLKRARTSADVRSVYSQSRYWLNPRWRGIAYVSYLYDQADVFIRAKADIRYPKSERPSSDDKRLEFFSAVMAGIVRDISPATALDLIRKFKHPDDCLCRRCLKRYSDCAQ